MKIPMRRNDLVYPELSYLIVGCAFEVYNELGPGHSEKTYHNALAKMFRKNDLKFEEQVYYPVRFKDEVVSRGFADFRVDDKIIVEIKKGGRYSKNHLEQVIDYIKRSKLKLGILINFTIEGVTFKRIINIDQSTNTKREVYS